MNVPGDEDKTRLAQAGEQVDKAEDKTRISPSVPAAGVPTRPMPSQSAAPDSNRTRIAGAPPLPSAREAGRADADRTQFNPAHQASPADADRTQFNPVRQASPADVDRTQFNPAHQASPAAADRTQIAEKKVAPPPSDITQFNPSQRPVAAAASDITQYSPSAKNAALASGIEASSPHEYPILKKRFVFEELLGVGGMGAVYKAKDLLKVEAQDRDPYVAIKVLNDEFKTHPEAFIALQRESRKSQKIAHPNIVNVYDFDRDGDTVFMTMEYLEGKPLDKLISQYRGIGLPSDEVFKILEGICAALIYAHAQNIIHSDFKPGNIFVNNQGFAKVFDFGIARAVAKADQREETLDDRTVFDAGKLGALTPAYASLEMLEGLAPSTRDDIYALGCIAYELYTGVHPFNRVHANEAKRQKLKPKRIPGLAKHQWKAIERALAFERENRTESVEVFWRELTRKNVHAGKIALALVLLLGAAGAGYYKFKPEAQKTLSEAEVRSQIEKKLRLELTMKALTDLMAAAQWTSAVEEQLWAQVQELRQLLGKNHNWLLQQEASIYARYLKEIETTLAASDFDRAQVLTTNAYRYAIQTDKLKEFAALIAKGIEEKKRQELARLEQLELQRQQKANLPSQPQVQSQAPNKDAASVAERNNLFQVGLGSVNTQLECQSNIDMKDFDIAITKLKSLNSVLYLKEEPRITSLLAKCIEHIGTAFPERAMVAKSAAMRIFNGNPTIAAIKIAQKDPCGSALAGLGSRGVGSSCKDKLSGASRAPAMVVIPGKGNIKTFAIGKFEVSSDELNEYCQQVKSCDVNSGGEGSLPATGISLSAANGYAKWLSEKSSHKYRLPTLSEWQYAARASGGRVDQNRNCKLNSRGIQKGNSLIKVAIGQQNEWGLVNYLGNAREWVESDGGVAVVGGSFETPMEECDINSKLSHDGRADAITGFRLVREVNE
ncbi:MAG TPA: protein kinase [Cellvibrio sp.]|nr:protein kinase [Cellvibrio sp.]